MIDPDSFQLPQSRALDPEYPPADHDHRKRRRNRTTQSCLNCHTSKRKCDRKRPCQRCIQLGLTGLCVYEIDDPALRDDPSIDETTRLKNRIAELESLVRELRGKPHPRWAEISSAARDSEPGERWHARPTRCVPLKRRTNSSERQVDRLPGRVIHSLLSPIKTEPTAETPAQMYRMTPSPVSSTMRYPPFPPSPSTSSFDHEVQPSYTSSVHYQTPSSSPSLPYHNGPNPGSVPSSYSDSYSDGGGKYNLSGSEDGRTYSDHYPSHDSENFCPCRAHPTTNLAYVQLADSLQNSLTTLRQYPHHPHSTPCLLYRRVVELNDVLQYVFVGQVRTARASHITHPSSAPADSAVHAQYDNGTDREIVSPAVSTGSGQPYANSSSGGVSPHEWNLTNGGYNTYFPSQSDHALYTNQVMT